MVVNFTFSSEASNHETVEQSHESLTNYAFYQMMHNNAIFLMHRNNWQTEEAF